MISSFHVVVKHARGDDLESKSYQRTKVPECPLCASCFKCGVIALLARGHAGPCVPPASRCRHPSKPTTTLHPTHPQASLPTHTTPQNSSTRYHQLSVPHSWGGTLVKFNPIIRLSAVQEKKENFTLVNSRLPFFFHAILFTPSGGKWHLGPLRPVAFVFLQSWFSIHHSLIGPSFLIVCLV